MRAIRDAKITLGVDPLGGAGIDYWPRIAEQYGLDLTIVNKSVDIRCVAASKKRTVTILFSELGGTYFRFARTG